jgi:hypothetical protein
MIKSIMCLGKAKRIFRDTTDEEFLQSSRDTGSAKGAVDGHPFEYGNASILCWKVVFDPLLCLEAYTDGNIVRPLWCVSICLLRIHVALDFYT